MHTLSLQVDGMTCASCVRAVTHALMGVPGVTSAEVDLRGASARVTADSLPGGTQALVDAVREAGYTAREAPPAAAAAPGRGAGGGGRGCGCSTVTRAQAGV